MVLVVWHYSYTRAKLYDVCLDQENHTAMKHIEIVDGALNSRFELYAVTDQIFDLLFPAEEDEIYLEDLNKELQEDAAFWDQVYAREVDRRTVKGIHGILHTHPKAIEQTAS